jgi:hypothetical protein
MQDEFIDYVKKTDRLEEKIDLLINKSFHSTGLNNKNIEENCFSHC